MRIQQRPERGRLAPGRLALVTAGLIAFAAMLLAAPQAPHAQQAGKATAPAQQAGNAKTPGQAAEITRLLERADNVFRSKTAASVLDMEVKTSSFTRSYKVVSWDDRRGRGRVLVKILGPAMWRGYGTLKVGNQLKLYNPRTNHVSVVSHSMLGDSWMGSHLTNDDLVRETELARDYTLKLERRWQGQSPLSTAATFYRIRMAPRPTAPVAWERIDYELFDDGTHVLPLKAEYYRKARDARPERTLTFSEISKLGGRTVPTRMTVTVADKPGEFTRITYRELRYDVRIPDSKFTEQALRQ